MLSVGTRVWVLCLEMTSIFTHTSRSPLNSLRYMVTVRTGDHVLTFDIFDLGLSDLGHMRSDGIYPGKSSI